MKNILLFCLITFVFNSTFGQAVFTKLLEKKYSELPVKLRIENSGIYAISSFDVENGNIWIRDFDSQTVYCLAGSQLKKTAYNNVIAKDFVNNNQQDLLFDKPTSSSTEKNLTLKKSFLFNKEDIFVDEGGVLSNSVNDKIIVNVRSRNELQINYNIADFNKIFKINFPSNLAYADLIGIDSSGNSFILIETYLSETPLKVQREIYAISDKGQMLSILEIPSIKYLYMVRDFQIDAAGNLYQLISDKEKISIIKLSGLTEFTAAKISYPAEYNFELNYNYAAPIKDAETGINKIAGILSSSRTTALRIAESYALFKYTCKTSNLAPADVRGPDGDMVRTPGWLIAGENARIPYMWGGFSTLSQFSSGLQNGRYAGDINTAGVSNYAVGVDCSGFVSRCWQLSYHSSTSDMPSITTQYSSWDNLKPGDAIHKVGHVRMFIDKTSNGALRVIESSARNWDVSYWTYAPSDLTAYTPRYYNGMVNDYSTNQPVLLSVLKQAGGKVILQWSCDTTNVKGYRLYKSNDGTNWNLILDESALRSMSTTLAMNSNSEYYRVSSVLNNPPFFSESNWSNVLGAGMPNGSKKILIVDGFNRESGDWRGKGTIFALQYGKGLASLNLNFESVKNTAILDSSVNLNNYNAVYWMLGDESTADETFSSSEQAAIIKYLESGGNFFVSGSEVGWDLFYKGSSSDKSFYNNYLKANFISDNSASNSVSGIDGSSLAGASFYFGQTYEVNYPDEIGSFGGSTICMKYSNNKGAGIEYSGTFGNSTNTGKLIYLGFPLETTASDTSFNSVIKKSTAYFFPGITSAHYLNNIPVEFGLSQNYPNPFNPTTTINYSIPKTSFVTIKVYDIIGNEVATLVNGEKQAGRYSVRLSSRTLSGRQLASGAFANAGYASGVYFYRMQAADFSNTKKLVLIK